MDFEAGNRTVETTRETRRESCPRMLAIRCPGRVRSKMSNSRSLLGCIALLTMVSATFEVGSAQTAVGYQRCRMFCGISEPVRSFPPPVLRSSLCDLNHPVDDGIFPLAVRPPCMASTSHFIDARRLRRLLLPRRWCRSQPLQPKCNRIVHQI
ncbi:hypothetical protein HPB47_006410 [Ixodes persulcatus]|uniref:Uncharacterized protein n=1 Tax=Ixodes persulcatus TaxID=34615 RepID=A0AC60PB11_IXOPE|nr:hypothetical protein HPB47_006410 [Ixodes persulcatus]